MTYLMAIPLDEVRRYRSADTRTPPHDLAAETSLLGAMLLSTKAIDVVADVGVTSSDFYRPQHGFIYDAIVALHLRGEPSDPVTVADELHRRSLLETVGGAATLVSLQNGTPAISNAGKYAKIVADYASLRRLIEVAGEVAEIGYSLPDDVNEAIARAQSLVEVVTQASGNGSSMWSDVRAALAAGLDLEPPSIAPRDDKACCFLYPGRVHLLNGESEAGKSLLTSLWAKQVMESGGHVLELDWEDSLVGHLSRLHDMGTDESLMESHYHYSQRDESWTAASRLELRRSLETWKPQLVIIDAMTPALATEGADDYRAVDIAKFYSDVIRSCRDSGAAVVIIDHLNRDGNTDFGGGGSHYKKGGIDGVSYVLKKAQPLGRGLFGRSVLGVVKDRHGFLRGVAVEGKMIGVLEVDGTQPGKLTIKVVPPSTKPIGTVTEDGNKRYPAIMEAMSRMLEQAGDAGLQANQLRAVVKGRTASKGEAISALVSEGFAIWSRVGGRDVLVSVEPFPTTSPYTFN